VAGHYQPLADDDPVAGASDQTLSFLQSTQKAKRSIPTWGRECLASISAAAYCTTNHHNDQLSS